MDKQGKQWLDRVVDYLYWRARQDDVQTQSDYEDFTLALHVIGQVRDNAVNPYESAFITAFGTRRSRFLEARRQREWEFAKALRHGSPQPAEAAGTAPAGKVLRMPAAVGQEQVDVPQAPARPRKAAAGSQSAD